MSKRITHKRYYGNRDKYSLCQTPITMNLLEVRDASAVLVPVTTTEGMRKVKHLTISFSTVTGANNVADFYWAIVYVPSGYTVNPIGQVAGNFYDPPQFVMSSGVYEAGTGPNRIYSKLSRNLNAGDSIYLVVKRITDQGFNLAGLVQYAVSLQ